MVKCWDNLRIKLGLKRPPLPENRIIPLGPNSQLNFEVGPYSLVQLYGNNEIHTSRYTWYGFVFQNLEEQAQRIANFYFLCIAIIQLFIETPVSPITSILPLAFVILLTMGKQGYEDWLRHKADREVNHIPVQIVTIDGELQMAKAYEIKVGDIVLVRSNETFPCDMLLISSSEPSGECFVTTASLDGETNLKRFLSVSSTKSFDTPELISLNLRGSITCQQPIDDFYKFFGKVEITNIHDNTEIISPLSPECLLLRGARLRNTDYIYGCAVYTGSDTKMSLNGKGKQTKYSQIERQLNNFLIVFLCVLLSVSCLYTILKETLILRNVWYIYLVKTSTWIIVQDFLGFLVLFNFMIPISLYVTIELQKFFGSMFFGWDVEMYDDESNQPALANTSDILEEMGQIEYLFTDKTGTLTENCMVFQRFSVAAGTFIAKNRRIFPIDSLRVSTIEEIQSPRTAGVGIDAAQMPPSALTLFLVLALCHTVRVERNALPPEGSSDNDKKSTKNKRGFRHLINSRKRGPPARTTSILRRASAMQSAAEAVMSIRKGKKVSGEDYEYQASSPDEKAFVESCREFGVVFHGLDQSGFLVVTVNGRAAMRYRLLDILEFDSTRKCMSVVIQPVLEDSTSDTNFQRDKPVLLLCKGAETSLLSKVKKSDSVVLDDETGDLLIDGIFNKNSLSSILTQDIVMERVNDFASSGLRTLVMGARFISADQWLHYKSQLDLCRSRLEGRDKAVDSAYTALETGLTLVGCTGIEDKLQQGVPETLSSLRRAGIQIWILTGDKEETAVNISYSAGHFAPNLSTVRITKIPDLHQCLKSIETHIGGINEATVMREDYRCGLVVDGQSLNFALTNVVREKFLQLCQKCDAVLCCRLTPIQKADIVRMMKTSRVPNPVCAAIGDGANDVSMILEAHVGFGLFGKEGYQAARSADYAFTRFRSLERAILFHGHTYYVRTANLVQYFFYKNLVFTLTQILFGFFSQFSMQSVYSNLYLLVYNITMTSFPVMFYGIFEQILPESVLLKIPELYCNITRNKLLTWKNFFIWMGFGIWHGLAIFFLTYFLASSGSTDTGNNIGFFDCFGSFLIVPVFIIATLKLLIISYNLNALLISSVLGTFVVNFMIFVFANFVTLPFSEGDALIGIWSKLYKGQAAYTTVLGTAVLIIICLCPDIVYKWHLDVKLSEKTEYTTKMNNVKPLEKSPSENVFESNSSAVNAGYYGSIDYTQHLVGTRISEKTPSHFFGDTN